MEGVTTGEATLMSGMTPRGIVTAAAVGLNVALAWVEPADPLSLEGLLAGVNLAALAMFRSWHTSLTLAMGFVLYLVLNMFVCLMAINAAMMGRDAAPLMLLAPTALAAVALLAHGGSVEWADAERDEMPDEKPDPACSAARIWR